MIFDIKVKEPNKGKRKRIPIDPALKQGMMLRKEMSIHGNQVQTHHDDRDPDMMHHFRINTRLEEERTRNYWPTMGSV